MRVSDIEMIRPPEWRALMIRVVTNAEEISGVVPRTLQRIGEYMREWAAMPAGVPYVCVRNYRNVDPKRIELEIGFPLTAVLPDREEIRSVVFPERRVIFALYRGAYDQMDSLYEEMTAWLKKQGEEPLGDAYEYYYNGLPFPMEEMITQVVIPLKE